MEESINQCVYLNDLMKVQQTVIVNHLDEHKWCNHIEDKNLAVVDFIAKYGWIMREIYCETCDHKKYCKARAELIKIKEIDNVQ